MTHYKKFVVLALVALPLISISSSTPAFAWGWKFSRIEIKDQGVSIALSTQSHEGHHIGSYGVHYDSADELSFLLKLLKRQELRQLLGLEFESQIEPDQAHVLIRCWNHLCGTKPEAHGDSPAVSANKVRDIIYNLQLRAEMLGSPITATQTIPRKPAQLRDEQKVAPTEGGVSSNDDWVSVNIDSKVPANEPARPESRRAGTDFVESVGSPMDLLGYPGNNPAAKPYYGSTDTGEENVTEEESDWGWARPEE